MNHKRQRLDNEKKQKAFSVRLYGSAGKKAKNLMTAANNKKYGRKIKLDDLLELILDRVSDNDIKLLQKRSLRSDERKEMMRQKYIEIYGSISKEKFTDFMMSADYISFLQEHIEQESNRLNEA